MEEIECRLFRGLGIFSQGWQAQKLRNLSYFTPYPSCCDQLFEQKIFIDYLGDRDIFKKDILKRPCITKGK